MILLRELGFLFWEGLWFLFDLQVYLERLFCVWLFWVLFFIGGCNKFHLNHVRVRVCVCVSYPPRRAEPTPSVVKGEDTY